MTQLLIAIGLQALYQIAAEHALAQGVLLTRKMFLAGRTLIWIAPLDLVRAAAVIPLGLPAAATVARPQLHLAGGRANGLPQ